MKRPISVGQAVVDAYDILHVELSRLDHGEVTVHTKNVVYLLTDMPALDFLHRYHPSVLEGRRFRWARHAWAFHNLVAHPVMQLLAFLGLGRIGVRLHDLTIPKPSSV